MLYIVKLITISYNYIILKYIASEIKNKSLESGRGLRSEFLASEEEKVSQSRRQRQIRRRQPVPESPKSALVEGFL